MTDKSTPLSTDGNVTQAPWLYAQNSDDIIQPWHCYLPHQQEMVEEHRIFNEDVQIRLRRYIMIWSIPLAMLVAFQALMNYSTFSLSTFLGVSIFWLYTVYFATLTRLMWPAADPRTDAHLFKIQTKLFRVKGWANMRIANTQLLFPHRPIQSISEFSAIAGGQAKHSIANLGPMTWVGLVMMYGSHVQCNDGNSFEWDIAEYLIIIGVGGIIMIGMFELNHFDRGMRIFHYTGVVMAICILAACLIQGWSLGGYNILFPLLLNIVAWPCFLVWRWYSSTERANQFQAAFLEYAHAQHAVGGELNDHCRRALYREINWYSVKCVLLEGIAIYCTTTALSWYVFQWGNTCRFVVRCPGKLENALKDLAQPLAPT